MKRTFVFGLTLLCCLPAFADGGRLRFSRTAGPFTVTLFTTPEPLTPGPADFSVMVQDAQSGAVLSDARITIQMASPGGMADPLRAIATHGIATNRLLQAAQFDLAASGVWQLRLVVEQSGRSAALDAPIAVEPGSRKAALAWTFALLPLLAIGLFILHQRQRIQLARRTLRTGSA